MKEARGRNLFVDPAALAVNPQAEPRMHSA
jgi:hypothetical protein